ncbi:hypothetical protein BASA61_005283 [Batrachochytrium salamandrivorans]|nr:hypothetical protein BASA61_005283 [Batrachochytrium salamandrivorans]
MKLNACLTSDAWSNIKNKPIVNYMLISDSLTFFLDSVPTGEQNHNAKWIAQDMERMVDFLAEKVCGAVTDNTTTNQSAWSILKKKYPSLFFQEKSEHVLHHIGSARDFIQAIGKQKESQQKIHDIITDERSYLLQLLQSRLDFLYGDAIGIAYLLDPRFVGEKMTAFERTRVEDLIFDYGSETEQSQQMGKKEEMYLQYTNFVIKANHNKDRKDFRFLMLKKGTKTILQFWLVDGLEFSQLARSCSAGVRYGCAQVPRQRGVFPPWGFVHSKLRSSLGSEKGEEESGVYQNKCFSV